MKSIVVNTDSLVEAVTGEIYSTYADLKVQFNRSVDETVDIAKAELRAEAAQLSKKMESAVELAKTEMRSETSQLARKLDGLIVKMVEDKVSSFIGSEAVMEAVVNAVKSQLTPDMVMKKPWWKWW